MHRTRRIANVVQQDYSQIVPAKKASDTRVRWSILTLHTHIYLSTNPQLVVRSACVDHKDLWTTQQAWGQRLGPTRRRACCGQQVADLLWKSTTNGSNGVWVWLDNKNVWPLANSRLSHLQSICAMRYTLEQAAESSEERCGQKLNVGVLTARRKKA